jgi:hypothetical protein
VTVNPIAPTFSNGGVFTIANRDFGDAPFTPAYPTSNSSGVFTYTSSVPSVATVNSSSGVVTIVSIGSTTIRATQAASGGYTSAYFEASVTINPIAPTFGSFSIDSRDFGATPFTLTAPSSNSLGAFTYQSSDESVATVTRFTTNSLLARYDASQASNYMLSGSNVTQWNDLTGNGYHLTQNGTGPSLTTINSVTAFDFSSSRGLIRASVPLNSVITVFMVIRYSDTIGIWGSFMHHGDRDSDWAIERNSFSGTPHNIQFQSNNENGRPELIATNGVNYILVCRISGNTREFWRYSDTQALGSATSTGVTIVTGNKILYVGKSDVNEACNSTIGEILYYNATLSNADVNANVLYLQNKWFNNQNTPPSYVTVVGAGTTIITATQEAAGSYTSGSITAPFVVNPIAPTFSNGGVFTIANRDVGDAPFTPTYLTSNSSGAFTYTSSVPSVASVHPTTGLVTIVSIGTTTIRATQAAAGNYTSAYFEDSFNVMTWGQRGQDINGERINDNSGWSISLSSSGNTLAIGAHLNDGTGTNAGHARIYDWDTVTIPNQWTKRGQDIDGEAAVDYSGISVSLSSDGNIVAIGAHYNDGSGSNAGHVRVYYWDTVSTPNKWTKRGSDIDGETAEDNSGISVSLSSDGNTVAIGATYNDGSGSNAGNVRIYDWNTVAWIQRGQDIDGEAANDNSGVSVSLSSDGNTVAVGARYNDGSASNAGHARVYDWDTVAWTQRGQDINGEAAGDNSGISVSLSSSGNTVAIGARYNDGTVPNSDRGHVRIYDWDTVAWTQRGQDIDGEAESDNSGFSVSLSSDGNTVAIGGPYNDNSGLDAGHVRVYDWDTVAWTQRGSDIDGEAAGDYSGWSVSLSSGGNILAVGALYNDGFASNAGQARVFKYE